MAFRVKPHVNKSVIKTKQIFSEELRNNPQFYHKWTSGYKPKEALLPEEQRREYINKLSTPDPETIIEKEIIVYDNYQQKWILVKESESYKYKY